LNNIHKISKQLYKSVRFLFVLARPLPKPAWVLLLALSGKKMGKTYIFIGDEVPAFGKLRK
jgi:hypothetical protein